MPKLLAAPLYLEPDTPDALMIRGLYCYVQRHPGAPGFSLLYRKQGENISLQVGDWNGGQVVLDDPGCEMARLALPLIERKGHLIYLLLHTLGITQAQLFFTSELRLTDVQTHPDKLIGPGMLSELFGKLVETPETIKIEVIDQRAWEAIEAGAGDYAGDLILKPSRFRNAQLSSGKFSPLYVQVLR
jgi:hypothetical protein